MILTPFKLWIKRAFFSQHRYILFDIQAYEQQEQGEIQREVAEALGEEWQGAIEEYWRRCEVALDWWERMERVRREERRRGRVKGRGEDAGLGLEDVFKGG